jgi:hypothetical protein
MTLRMAEQKSRENSANVYFELSGKAIRLKPIEGRNFGAHGAFSLSE